MASCNHNVWCYINGHSCPQKRGRIKSPENFTYLEWHEMAPLVQPSQSKSSLVSWFSLFIYIRAHNFKVFAFHTYKTKRQTKIKSKILSHKKNFFCRPFFFFLLLLFLPFCSFLFLFLLSFPYRVSFQPLVFFVFFFLFSYLSFSVLCSFIYSRTACTHVCYPLLHEPC